MMCLLDELPSDVEGSTSYDMEQIGDRVKDLKQLGEWHDLSSLSKLLGESIKFPRTEGDTPSSALEASLHDGFKKRIQVDVGEYRFCRNLGIVENQIYMITKNPKYYDYKQLLGRIYRLGASPQVTN
jgi:hypothetical protein